MQNFSMNFKTTDMASKTLHCEALQVLARNNTPLAERS